MSFFSRAWADQGDDVMHLGLSVLYSILFRLMAELELAVGHL